MLLPLPAGPCLVWALDHNVNFGMPSGPLWQLLVAICCINKFCVLMLLHDSSTLATIATFQERVVAVFGAP